MKHVITRLRSRSRRSLSSSLAMIVLLPLGATVGLGLTASTAQAAPERPVLASPGTAEDRSVDSDIEGESVPLSQAVPWTDEQNVAAQAHEEFDALVFSKTAAFRHSNIDEGIAAIQKLGAEHHFSVTVTEDGATFTDANLEQFEVVIFLSTTGDVLTDAQQGAFERYIRAGGGFAGIHAASDTEYSWPWYGNLVGAYFNNHPSGTPTATVKVEDPAHPSTAGIEPRWQRTDEWYNFRTNPRGKVHVLASMDETTYAPGAGAMGVEHPIAWCQEYDGGRSWYTGMGHTEASFVDAKFLGHILGGIKTAAGVMPSDCTATLEPSFEKVALDENTSNPMELDIADDGRVFYVDRNGAVRVILPNGNVETAGVVPVYTGQEFGMLGIALDPDFATNNWVYLYYSPVGTTAVDRIARYTMSGNTLQLDTATTILDVPTQRDQCCHAAGSMEFDNDGNLYLATGDNTNPFDSGGYTPIDERPGRSAWDAQRTSANTNNLMGKVLRIKPLASGGYAIPEGNLFDEAADAEEKTRPEIYAMGFRNPFRIGLDEQNNNLLVADFGPDAGSVSSTRGPNGRVEWNVLDEPGNYGWPYCVGNNTPYNDYNFATSTPGPTFNCAAPVNDSPNNTGLTNLPPAKTAVMWQSNNASMTGTPEIGASGAPITSGTYSFDPDLASDRKWPQYFDRKAIWADWNNNRLFTVQLNQNGTTYTDLNRFLPSLPMRRPHAMQFGPDGALYMIEWGSGFNGNNADSGIYRIDYVEGNRAPVARATTDRTSGPAPLTVAFDGSTSFDPDTGGATGLTYAWDFDGNGTTDATTPTGSHTYAAGNYTARLTVTDEGGRTGTTNIDITAGNTAPTVELVLPENGGLIDFGDHVKYEVKVSDPEDGTIDCNRVVVQPGLGHDQHSHDYEQYRGCSGTFALPGDSGHVGANIFGTVKATYTDNGSGAARALTSVDGIILHTKKKEAEFFDATGRTGSEATGTPGVSTQTTTDTGGGRNLTGIETGDWFRWDVMNLTGITGVTMRVASTTPGAEFAVRQGSPTGTTIGTVAVPITGGAQTYQNASTTFTGATTTSEPLYVVATAGGANVNWLEFAGRGITHNQPPTVAISASTTNGAAPLPVQFTSTVSDPDGDTPVTYAWSFGDGATSTEADPSHTYTTPGKYVVSLTATDARGARTTRTLEITVTQKQNICFSGRSDDFLGTELDTTRWNRNVRVNQALTVADGTLNVPITQADLYQTTNTAPNIVLQDLPAGAFEVTTKVTVPAVRGYQQGGLVIYGDDDNYLKLVYSGRSTAAAGSKAANIIQFTKEVNAIASESNSTALGATFPDTVWLRMTSTDGILVTPSYSTDGATWLPITTSNGTAAPRELLGITAPKVGLLALGSTAAAAADNITAKFDYFTITPDSRAVPCPSDTAAPTTTLTLPAATGQAGWYTTRPSFTLTASDNDGGSGVASTQYRIAGGSWTAYTAPVPVPGEGERAIEFRSTDKAGNVEVAKSRTVRVDTVVPTATATESGDRSKTVTLTASDATSGVARIDYQIDDDTSWRTYTAPLSFDEPGTHDVRYRAIDVAGNVSTVGTSTVEVPDTTAPDVGATVLGSFAGELVDQASSGVTGEATMVSAADGDGYTATVELSLAGLDPTQGYESHLHVGTDCGGFEGHYRDDLDGAGTPPNELWPTNPDWVAGSGEPRIKAEADGTSFATATVPWAPRIEGGILALHRDGAIIGCVDLALTGAGTVVLDATDDVEVTSLTYTVDDGDETEYVRPFEIAEPGAHLVAYTASDAAGNRRAGEFTVVVPTDPPTVTMATTPGEPDGRDGWYTSPVRVSLEGDGGDGELTLEYRVGEGAWTAYTAPFDITADGTSEVRARATDGAGRVSETVTTTVKRDATAPSSTVTGIADGAQLQVDDVRTAQVTSSDATSGVAQQVVRLDGNVVSSPVRVDAMRLLTGTHRLEVEVTDVAGNRRVQTVTFQVVATYAGGQELVDRLHQEGELDAISAAELRTELDKAQRADVQGNDRQARKALSRFQAIAVQAANGAAETALVDVARHLEAQL